MIHFLFSQTTDQIDSMTANLSRINICVSGEEINGIQHCPDHQELQLQRPVVTFKVIPGFRIFDNKYKHFGTLNS